MSLDQNLFTLLVTPNNDPSGLVLDLIDPSGNVHYRRYRVPGHVYKIEVYDPIAQSMLASATAPSATKKHKTIELFNPTQIVELKFVGTLSFKWAFKWEEHDFEWKREECFMIRKPDPPVLVAVTKEFPNNVKPTSIQILDYNLNRFDVKDRKGLEIVMLTALLTFQDATDVPTTTDTPVTSPPVNPTTSRKTSDTIVLAPPNLPPKPPPKTGLDRVVEMQIARGEVNEVCVEEEGNVDDYARYCANMLEDDAMLFIAVRSSSAAQVPKVLQVVEETKRIRHKAGLSDEGELHQYVFYQTPAKKGPRIINLDDNKSKNRMNEDKYSPPSNLTVHLSKIDMPELRPQMSPPTSGSNRRITSESEKAVKGNGKRDKEKGREKKHKEKSREKDKTEKEKSRKPTSDEERALSKLSKSKPPPPNIPPRPSYPHVYPHQPHPYQPSPSPSQLGNPAIYATHPPPRVNQSTSYSQRPPTKPRPGSSPQTYPSQPPQNTGYLSAQGYTPQPPHGTPTGGLLNRFLGSR